MDKETFDELRERFDELYADSCSDVRNRILAHFEGDKWTNKQLEELWGTHIASFDGMNEVERAEAEENGTIDIDKAIDYGELDDLLSGEDFTLGTLIDYADSFEIDLEGHNNPFKIIIFTPDVDPDKYGLTDSRLGEIDENTIDPADIEQYVVCSGRDDMLDKWEELYKTYEGEWYYVKDGENILVGGAMDAYDLDTLENMRPFSSDHKLGRQERIDGILDHFFDEYDQLRADIPSAELGAVYGLEIASTDGCSAEEYETIYNDDTVVTDKNARDKDYMRESLNYSTDAKLKELYEKFSGASQEYETAKRLIGIVENGFGAIYSTETKGVPTPAILKKDPSIEGVYEFWIKVGADENTNGGKILGKIFDLNGADEVSNALKGIENGTAVISTRKGRMPLADAVKSEKRKNAEIER